MEVWENEKRYSNTSCRQVFPQLFRVLLNSHECFYKGLFTRCDLSCRFVGPEKLWSKSGRLFWPLWSGLVLSKRQGYSDHCDIRRLISFSSNDLFFLAGLLSTSANLRKGYERLGCKIGPDAGKSAKLKTLQEARLSQPGVSENFDFSFKTFWWSVLFTLFALLFWAVVISNYTKH